MTGVTVTIDVLDSNGNYRNIGSTTSDASGNFGLAWEPDIPGFYTVVATFPGSNSYGSSYSMTYFNVEEAPQATPPPTAPPAPMTDTYVAGFGIAILIVVIIFGILIVLVLRRK